MTELSIMLLAGDLVDGATVTITVDKPKRVLKYEVDLSHVPVEERTQTKRAKPSAHDINLNGPIIEEMQEDEDMED